MVHLEPIKNTKKMSTINRLKQKIKTLEKRLEKSKSHTYVHDSTHYWTESGEFHMFFGNEQSLTWEIDDLYKTLEFLNEFCIKHKQKNDAETLERIVECFDFIKKEKK